MMFSDMLESVTLETLLVAPLSMAFFFRRRRICKCLLWYIRDTLLSSVVVLILDVISESESSESRTVDDSKSEVSTDELS